MMTIGQTIARILGLRVVHQYKIEPFEMKMPTEGHMVIVKAPRSMPKNLLKELQDRFVEFQNQDMRFMITTLDLEFIETEKGLVKVRKDNEGSTSRGDRETKRQG